MTETVTLKLPDTLARRAKAVARETNRPVEDVLIEWLNQVEVEPPVDSLPNDQLLALCDLQMESEQSEEMSDLLGRNREGQLNEADRQRLDELMEIYRTGLVRKAKAIKVAVERGLRPALN